MLNSLFIFVSNKRPKLKLSVYFNFVNTAMNFYAVAKGRKPGIYHTWNDCKAQVDKFSGSIYKKFSTNCEAEAFIKQHSGAVGFDIKSAGSNSNNLFSTGKACSLGKNKYVEINKSSKRQLSSCSNSSDNEEVENIKRKKYSKSVNLEKSVNKDGFTVDENGFTEVYTDGACSSNGRGNAKAGIGVWFSDNCSFNVSQPVVGRATNNMAEIQAVTIAAKQAQKAGVKKLKIITDSQFLISCITEWMPKWKRSNWRTSTGKPVINKTELIEMEKALTPLQISWNHVRGHVGIHGNEMADKLARNGCERYKT